MFVVVFVLAKPAECWWTFSVVMDLVFIRMPDESGYSGHCCDVCVTSFER